MTTTNSTITQPCMICGGSAPDAPRIDLASSFIVGVGLIIGLLVWGAMRVMRDENKGVAQDRGALLAKQRANEAAIKVGLVV